MEVLSLYDVAIGPDFENGERRGHAKGIVAIGDIATGAVAVGGIAQDVIAVGGAAVNLGGFGPNGKAILILCARVGKPRTKLRAIRDHDVLLNAPFQVRRSTSGTPPASL